MLQCSSILTTLGALHLQEAKDMKSKECSLNIRVPAELYERLEMFAAQQCTSKSELSRALLIRALHDAGSGEYEFLSLAEWAKAVKYRDAGVCRKCGAMETLHAHHIRPVYQGGKNTLANGVTLCRTCHSDTHSPDIRRAFDRVVYNTKLPKWLVDWLRQQDRPAVRIIEEALIEEYKLFPPE